MPLNRHVLRSTLVGALGGLLFGFDTAVISGTTAALTHVYHLSPAKLGFTVSIALWGTVIGSISAGSLGQKYGSREMLRWMAALYVASSLGCAFAWSWQAFLAARFLGGLGIGGSSVLSPVYIAELAPARLRGRLVGTFQINIVVGILLAYFSNYLIGLAHLGAVEWRWQLGVAAFPSLLFLLLLLGISQSSRWLATQDRMPEALAVLERMGSPDASAELAEIRASIEIERSSRTEPLFRRVGGKFKYGTPIFLALAIGIFNQLTGVNAILYYLNDIFAAAGFSRISSNLQAVAVGAMNLIATLFAMTLIDRAGRKRLLLVGSVGTAVCLGGVSAVFFTHRHAQTLVWLLVMYIAFFAVSQGAVIWVYISEIFPTRVRGKGQSLGCSTLWVMSALVSGGFPIVAHRSGAYPFVFFASMMLLQFFVVLLLFPETKQTSLEELQVRLGIA
ncbi:MAG: sugar porter family MFS transporter [Candidatus Acidiferrales bacterium]